ncbi:cytidine deaminase 1-like [Cynara cardunculus var. scolymus]|uniref:cytidine deaminase n=1 Tax=Cynara cardunculus var. scolymus TaxID=59895 RepID=A0A103Y2A0_CYNCS|nr:cytidine deaminase 1-like [Cynara cardunculus var. scolymus]KVI01207.1 APOBEC/CMP deaminase, zinc-binding [Cynara cardunculus var. scolymus]
MNQPPSKYIITASEAESMARSKGLSLPQLLPSLVKSAQDLARTPISNFAVGAVGLGSDGRIFFGCNIEFPGLPLHHSIHAEQFLITNLAAHGGGPKLLHIAVSAAPCGHCRQFLQELRNISETQIVITDQPEENPDYKPISSILPNPFGPFDLLDQETPLILEKHDNQLSLKHDSSIIQNGITPNLSNGNCELIDTNEEALKTEALEAARRSHAPYSNCPSGVALMDCEGKVYKGSYMESAAYNPSMMPVQAALVAYMVAGGGGYERIVAAVMVEKGGAPVRQEDTARLMMKYISPKCDFRVFHCV